MKVSYYDLFDMIAEDAGKLLSQAEQSPIHPENYSSDTTITAVKEKIKETESQKKRSHKKTFRLHLLIAAVIVLSLSGIACAAYQYDLFKDGAALITDENRDLVGKEIKNMTASIYDKNGNLVSGPGLAPEPTLEDVIEETDIIKDIEHAAGTNEPLPLPHSITHFAVKENGNSCTTPVIIFDNDVMVIFTKEDGSGWHLKKGETLVFESTEYPSEINAVTPDKGQCVGFYYVFNNTLMRKSDTSLRELDLKYELTAERDGEYYICLIGASSDPISLMEGKIYKR